MDIVMKTTGIVAVTVVIYLLLSKQCKEYAVVLSLAVGAGILVVAVNTLRPVMVFLRELQQVGNLNGKYASILLKATGIGMISQMAALTCQDAGNSALGKILGIVSVSVILVLSLPLFYGLLEIIQGILTEI